MILFLLLYYSMASTNTINYNYLGWYPINIYMKDDNTYQLIYDDNTIDLNIFSICGIASNSYQCETYSKYKKYNMKDINTITTNKNSMGDNDNEQQITVLNILFDEYTNLLLTQYISHINQTELTDKSQQLTNQLSEMLSYINTIVETEETEQSTVENIYNWTNIIFNIIGLIFGIYMIWYFIYSQCKYWRMVKHSNTKENTDMEIQHVDI